MALDADASELQKSDRLHVAVADICQGGLEMPGAPYDLVCSRMTAEHFRDAEAAHRNIYRALRPGGFALHSFATLYSLPFLINRIAPDRLSDLLLDLFRPRTNRHQNEKFKAYYSRCRGPVRGQIEFFQGIGYEVVEYHGYFGHTYYAKRVPLLDWAHQLKTRWLLKRPLASLTSYATVLLRRPV